MYILYNIKNSYNRLLWNSSDKYNNKNVQNVQNVQKMFRKKIIKCEYYNKYKNMFILFWF